MANEKEVFSIDLDNKDFLAKANQSQGALGKIGDPKNLDGAMKGLASLTKAAGVLGTAYLALKGTTEAVFKAERIKMVQGQFEALSQQAGVSGMAIKQAMIEGAEGTISQTKAMELANEAIIKLGKSSDKIPEIMQLANAASKVTGDTVENTFDRITTAIATGQTRTLKQMGIVVDSTQAYRDYAKQIGVSVDALSEQARIQAVATAALKQGNEAYKNANLQVDEATNTYEQFIATLENLRDIFLLVFEKTIGPVVTKTFAEMNKVLSGFLTSLTAEYGTGADQAAAKTQMLEAELKSLEATLDRLENSPKEQFAGGFLINTEALAEETRKKIEQVTSQIEEAKAKMAATGLTSPMERTDLVDVEKQKAQQLQLQQDLLKIRQQGLEQQQALSQSEEDAVRILNERKLILAQQFEVQKDQLRNEEQLKNVNNSAKIEALEQEKNFKLIQMDDEVDKVRSDALDRYLAKSQNVADGVARAFEVGGKRNAAAIQNWGNVGQVTFDAFATNASSALQAFGAGTKDAGEAFKAFMFGAIGDVAVAFGNMLLLKGIGTFDPVSIAAGSALLILGGFLKSLAGGGGGASPMTSSGQQPGSIQGFGTRAETEQRPVFKPEDKKAVTINIAGNYFETEQTRQRLTEIVRESGDYTDFTIQPIGG